MIRMNKQTLSRSCIAIGICMLMGSAWAQAAAPKAPAPAAAPTAAVQGSAAAGQKIAQSGTPQGAAACATCHGAKGEGMAGFPALAGQHAGYLARQLQHLADGSRQAPVMAPMAKALSAQDRADVSAYYASLPLPIQPVRGPLPKGKDDDGAWLVERGRWADGIPACAQCHGPGGVGVGAVLHVGRGGGARAAAERVGGGVLCGRGPSHGHVPRRLAVGRGRVTDRPCDGAACGSEVRWC